MTPAADRARGDCLSPTAPGTLLANPLDYIAEEHLREREICVRLDRIATVGLPDEEEITAVQSYLAGELPLHLEDEERDLFPLMRRRCPPEDEIGKVITRLLADHDQAHSEIPRTLAVLARILAEERAPTPDEAAQLTDFAKHARAHLIVENAIVLPIARARLTPHDLEALCRGMLKRRGLDRLMEDHDAG